MIVFTATSIQVGVRHWTADAALAVGGVTTATWSFEAVDLLNTLKAIERLAPTAMNGGGWTMTGSWPSYRFVLRKTLRRDVARRFGLIV